MSPGTISTPGVGDTQIASSIGTSPASTWAAETGFSLAGTPSEKLAEPWGSRSTTRTVRPVPAKAAARLTAVVVLPTPPLTLTNERIICSTPCGGAPDYPRNRPAGSSTPEWGYKKG